MGNVGEKYHFIDFLRRTWYSRMGDFMYDPDYFVKSKGIPFVSFRKELVRKGGNIPIMPVHYHMDFEIILVEKGEAWFEVNAEGFRAAEGSIVLINPYDTHWAHTESDAFSYVCLDFDVGQLALPDEHGLLEETVKYRSHLEGRAELVPYLLGAVSAFEETPKGWELAVRGNLLLFFAGLSDAVAPFKRSDDFTRKMLRYLERHLAEPVTSADAARALSYNPSYFCRLFKKSFSDDFSTVLNLRRVEKAKELLLSKSVSETAMACGFCSASYFSEVFRKATSLTPSQYKKGGIPVK